MAYVNIEEWSNDQIVDWLKGLDDVLQPYICHFIEKEVNGKLLLQMAVDDLPKLQVNCIGHQQIILQGIGLLRNIHYHIHQENIQQFALQLGSKARSIYNELSISLSTSEENLNEILDSPNLNESKKREKVLTPVVAAVADVVLSVKILVSWLHRTPFYGLEHYDELKSDFVDLSIKLAMIAQRDSFAENPVSVISETCLKLTEMADSIIHDSNDSLILQPASLDVVTIKKRADDNWGLSIFSTYDGVHQISLVKSLTPAHTSGKIMDGDQVVQVNYQTVLGWTSLKVTELMQENPTQVILTVKKCPRHVNAVSEIYFKPIRLPSKKRTYSPWNTTSRVDLQSFPNLHFVKSLDGKSAAERAISTEPHPKSTTPPSVHSAQMNSTLNSSESDLTRGDSSSSSEIDSSDFDDDAFMSDLEYEASSSLGVPLFHPKPRPQVQRRATIPGATPRYNLPYDNLLQSYHRPLPDYPDNYGSYIFRTKDPVADSRGATRPHTCIGSAEKNKTDPADKGGIEKRKKIHPRLKILDDRPKLDKSHSLPVHVMDQETENSNVAPVSPIEKDKHQENGPDEEQKLIDSIENPQVTVESPSGTCSSPNTEESCSRRISCLDLGRVDHQGWLYRRRDPKRFLPTHRWEKRWFILKKSYLYGFRDKDSLKADSLIFLPGFHVCPASDVKSKRFTFKIFHSSGATFYFACDSAEERSRWMSQMGLSALSPHSSTPPEVAKTNAEEGYYSETDDEFDRSPPTQQKSFTSTPSKESSGKELFSQIFKSSSRLNPSSPSVGGTPSKSPGFKFLQSSKSAMSQPMQASNFRSYVRVRDPETPSTPTNLNSFNSDAELSSKDETKDRSKVRRKESLREKLRQLPSSLTLDRRKKTSDVGKPSPVSSPRIVKGSKSETSLVASSSSGAKEPQHRSRNPIQLSQFDASAFQISSPDSSSKILRSSVENLTTPTGPPRIPPKREPHSEPLPPRGVEAKAKSPPPPPLKLVDFNSEIGQKRLAGSADLKRVANYQPPIRSRRSEEMKTAFEMNFPPNVHSSTPTRPQVTPTRRPQVPPRTKFLSPKERRLSPSDLEDQVKDEECDPQKLLKPTMGISMLGKKRSPSMTSPRDVFLFSPPSRTPFTASDGARMDQILPHYPGMEYPPTFEPESYSLNISDDYKTMNSSSKSHSTPEGNKINRSANSTPDTNKLSGYINISHVSPDFNEKSYHHTIYVTSPCKDDETETNLSNDG